MFEVVSLAEPELEFNGGKHIDIRYGLMNYGPFDQNLPTAPKEIKVGLIGTAESISVAANWLVGAKAGFDAKASKQPNLFPRFPGFGQESGSTLRTPLVVDDRLNRPIKPSWFRVNLQNDSPTAVCNKFVNIIRDELEYISQKHAINVALVALPKELLASLELLKDPGKLLAEEKEDTDVSRFDFHNALKARAMDISIPTQLAKPNTFQIGSSKIKDANGRTLQDEATRAWNLYVALYYKAGGVPWRIERIGTKYSTCYVGVSFYKSLGEESVQTSIAEIFNELGEGIVVRGGKADICKLDRQPHLNKEDAYNLMNTALSTYRKEHKTMPARIVLHKSSIHNEAETKGFTDALKDNGVELSDFVSITYSDTRLFRDGDYPPLRGTYLFLDDTSQILYTKGSIEFYRTYPGMYVPKPIFIRTDKIESDPKTIAEEILALSKMNWNDTQFDGGMPITIHAARKVGGILKYVDANMNIQPRYSYYM